MDKSFENLFNPPQAGQESTQPLDAKATQEIEPENSTTDLLPNEQEANRIELPETSNQDLSEEQPHVADDTAPNENSMAYWKQQADQLKADLERTQKQKSDYQSYTDKRINELQKEFSQKPAEQKPEVKQYSKEELNDIFYDNPADAMEIFAKQLMGQQAPQQNQMDIDLKIQEGVMRNLHDDYDDVVSQVQNAIAYNPEILQTIQQASNKAKAAYEQGKKLQAALKIQQDPEAFEAELRKKWEAENNGNQTQNKPSSIRSIPSSSPNPRTQVRKPTGKESFSSMFDGPKMGSR